MSEDDAWVTSSHSGTELVAWENPRNDARVTIRWKFTKEDARRVFAKYYPASLNC